MLHDVLMELTIVNKMVEIKYPNKVPSSDPTWFASKADLILPVDSIFGLYWKIPSVTAYYIMHILIYLAGNFPHLRIFKHLLNH